jgi:peptide/nickel transport system substrate-binding protein
MADAVREPSPHSGSMDRRTFLTTTLGAGGALLVGACGDAEEDRGSGPPGSDGQPADGTSLAPGASLAPAPRPTLRLEGADWGFPSPFGYARGPGYLRMSLIYDTLLWRDENGDVLPWLAERFEESADGRTYTFTLRDGILWQDGEPLVAEDVKFTFDYFAAQTISPLVIVQPIPEITEVVVIDERTVEFRLESPAVTFLQFGGAGAVPIVPRHIWSGIADAGMERNLDTLVGTGPYTLESYSEGEGAYLYTANEDFFLGRPFVERIEFRPAGDASTALLGGELDAVELFGARPEVLAPFERDDSYEILEYPPGSSSIGLYWNLARGGALSDVNFRHACARAIDRDDLVQRLFGGNATPGNPGWIPPGHPFHVEVEQYDFDIEAANGLLDDAGYTRTGDGPRQSPDGTPLRFELLVFSPVTPVVDLVVGALGAVGIELVATAVDVPTFNQRVLAGESELSLIGSGGMNSDLGADYLRLVYSSETTITQHAQGYANPDVDGLCQEQLEALDVDERLEIAAEIQALVAADLPLLPLFYPSSFAIVRPDVFDAWYSTPGGVAGNIPTILNKQVFVTGQPTGTEIRPTD